MVRTFHTFRAAADRARELSRSLGVSVSVRSKNGQWEVEDPTHNPVSEIPERRSWTEHGDYAYGDEPPDTAVDDWIEQYRTNTGLDIEDGWGYSDDDGESLEDFDVTDDDE